MIIRMIKVIHALGKGFDANLKRVLNQIVFEFYRFHKFTETLLDDSNKDAVKVVISSEKYSTYVRGIVLSIGHLLN